MDLTRGTNERCRHGRKSRKLIPRNILLLQPLGYCAAALNLHRQRQSTAAHINTKHDPLFTRVVREHHGPGASDKRVKGDRKSTRLNSSHMSISYAVFCLKKKKKNKK